MFALDTIPSPPLLLATLALCACADTTAPIAYGARVEPTNVGIEATSEPDGLSRTYRWWIHDYDGTTHILTWKGSNSHGEEVPRDFGSCLRNRCRTAFGALCPPKQAGDHYTAPQIFSEVLACAASAKLSGYQEMLGQPATEYRVMIVTGEAARYMADGEVRLGQNLGGKRIVVRHTENQVVVADVDSCLGSAAKHGVVETRGPAGRQYQTVEPLLNRFDDCLRSRSYTVKACSEKC